MSTTLTIDVVTTEVSTGITQSTFGNHMTLFIVRYNLRIIFKKCELSKYKIDQEFEKKLTLPSIAFYLT